MIKTVVVLSATLLFMLSFNFQCNLLKLVIKMPNLGNNASIKYQNFTEDNGQKLFGKLPSFCFLYLQYLRDIYLVFPFKPSFISIVYRIATNSYIFWLWMSWKQDNGGFLFCNAWFWPVIFGKIMCRQVLILF